MRSAQFTDIRIRDDYRLRDRNHRLIEISNNFTQFCHFFLASFKLILSHICHTPCYSIFLKLYLHTWSLTVFFILYLFHLLTWSLTIFSIFLHYLLLSFSYSIFLHIISNYLHTSSVLFCHILSFSSFITLYCYLSHTTFIFLMLS